MPIKTEECEQQEVFSEANAANPYLFVFYSVNGSSTIHTSFFVRKKVLLPTKQIIFLPYKSKLIEFDIPANANAHNIYTIRLNECGLHKNNNIGELLIHIYRTEDWDKYRFPDIYVPVFVKDAKYLTLFVNGKKDLYVRMDWMQIKKIGEGFIDPVSKKCGDLYIEHFR